MKVRKVLEMTSRYLRLFFQGDLNSIVRKEAGERSQRAKTMAAAISFIAVVIGDGERNVVYVICWDCTFNALS